MSAVALAHSGVGHSVGKLATWGKRRGRTGREGQAGVRVARGGDKIRSDLGLVENARRGEARPARGRRDDSRARAREQSSAESMRARFDSRANIARTRRRAEARRRDLADASQARTEGHVQGEELRARRGAGEADRGGDGDGAAGGFHGGELAHVFGRVNANRGVARHERHRRRPDGTRRLPPREISANLSSGIARAVSAWAISQRGSIS